MKKFFKVITFGGHYRWLPSILFLWSSVFSLLYWYLDENYFGSFAPTLIIKGLAFILAFPAIVLSLMTQIVFYEHLDRWGMLGTCSGFICVSPPTPSGYVVIFGILAFFIVGLNSLGLLLYKLSVKLFFRTPNRK